MPCRCDHMEPTAREIESQLVAGLLIHVLSFPSHAHIKAPEGLGDAVKSTYGNLKKADEWTALLCKLLSEMTDDELDVIVYNGRDKWARKLAEWKEKHEAADRKRKEEERKKREKKMLQQSGLKKLTADEIKALGIDPQRLR